MVAFSINSPITAREVLAVGPQSVPVIETALITLAHLSVHSEDIEVEVCSYFVQQNYILVCPVWLFFYQLVLVCREINNNNP